MDEAYRLTFEHDGERIALKSKHRLVKRVPRGQTPDQMARRDTLGSFVELRDAENRPLYRRRVADLFPSSLEYPTGDPARPLARTRSAPAHGIVSVLVPVRPGSRSVALVQSTGRPSGKEAVSVAQGYRDLIVIDLDEPTEDRP
jgi:hypothetical protein